MHGVELCFKLECRIGTFNGESLSEINLGRYCQQRSGGVTIKGRHPDGSPTDTPGPGAYDTPQRQGGGFSMAGRYSERPESGTPGPGAYSQGCGLSRIQWHLSNDGLLSPKVYCTSF